MSSNPETSEAELTSSRLKKPVEVVLWKGVGRETLLALGSVPLLGWGTLGVCLPGTSLSCKD